MQQQQLPSEQKEQIEIFVSCRSLRDMDVFSKSDPQVIIYLKDKSGRWIEYQKTEIIWDNLNPNFVKTFIMDYIFEVQQHIKFRVIDVDDDKGIKHDDIGEVETTVSALVGAKNQTLVLELKDQKGTKGGKLILRADKVQYCSEFANIHMVAKDLKNSRWFITKSNPFLRLYKLKENMDTALLVYQTEVVKRSLNPIWQAFELNLAKLCNADHYMPIKVELWDHHSSGKHKLMGETQFTLNQVIQQNQKTFQLNNNKSGKQIGNLEFRNLKVTMRPQFIDFIRGGTQLALVTAIDFTASNGYAHRHDSLHSYTNPENNFYRKAIQAVGEILINYDYDKEVPSYGFGGKPLMPQLTAAQVLHCFPLNGNPDVPECQGLEGIIEAYDYAIHNSELSGPTLFYPILSEVMKICQAYKQQNSNQYVILLILTDGQINDMEQTKKAIVDCDLLPLSIIIVGVGNADFTNMEVLDGDNGLWDSSGRKAKRDLVQFVPFNKFNGNPQLLAENVLEELPTQLVEYMQMTNQLPKPPQHIDLSQMFLRQQTMENRNSAAQSGGAVGGGAAGGFGGAAGQQNFSRQGTIPNGGNQGILRQFTNPAPQVINMGAANQNHGFQGPYAQNNFVRNLANSNFMQQHIGPLSENPKLRNQPQPNVHYSAQQNYNPQPMGLNNFTGGSTTSLEENIPQEQYQQNKINQSQHNKIQGTHIYNVQGGGIGFPQNNQGYNFPNPNGQ